MCGFVCVYVYTSMSQSCWSSAISHFVRRCPLWKLSFSPNRMFYGCHKLNILASFGLCDVLSIVRMCVYLNLILNLFLFWIFLVQFEPKFLHYVSLCPCENFFTKKYLKKPLVEFSKYYESFGHCNSGYNAWLMCFFKFILFQIWFFIFSSSCELKKIFHNVSLSRVKF